METDLVSVLRSARAQGLSVLDEPCGKAILQAAGIQVPHSRVVEVGHDLIAAVSDLRPPLVLKVIASGVVHKSDVGGVRLDLRSAQEVAAVAADLLVMLKDKAIQPTAWLVEETAPRGVEIVVGGTMDAEFGPMVMVGLGGIFVEVLKDVSFRICPIDARDARDMLDDLRGAGLLHGARGIDPASIDAIVDVLLRVGGEGGLLMQGGADLAELDINPLIVSREAACAVDARFVLNPSV